MKTVTKALSVSLLTLSLSVAFAPKSSVNPSISSNISPESLVQSTTSAINVGESGLEQATDKLLSSNGQNVDIVAGTSAGIIDELRDFLQFIFPWWWGW